MASSTSTMANPTALPRPPRRDVTSRLPARNTSTIDPALNLTFPVNGKSGPDQISVPVYDNPRLFTRTAQMSKPRKPVVGVSQIPSSRERTVMAPLKTVFSPIEPTSATTPTPSLVSGSSASTHGSPQSIALRRKPSIIGKFVSQKEKSLKPRTSSRQNVEQSNKVFLPASGDTGHLTERKTDNGPPSDRENERHARLASPFEDNPNLGHDYLLDRQTPLSNFSTTPSIPYTPSPGAFSQFTSTTSVTSQSPQLSASSWTGSNWDSPSKATVKQRLANTMNEKMKDISRKPLSKPDSIGALPKLTIPRPHIPPLHPPELAHLSRGSSAQKTSIRQPAVKSLQTGLKTPMSPALSGSRTIPRKSPTKSHNGPIPRVSYNDKVDVLEGRGRSASARPTKSMTPSPKIRDAAFDSPMEFNVKNPTLALPMPAPASSIPSPIPSKSRTVLSFFSRQSKKTPVPVTKTPKPGPMAGTGHEGYGKHLGKRRSGSSASAASNSGRSTSAGSTGTSGTFDQLRSKTSSKTDVEDDFLTKRLTPVYLRGDGSQTDINSSEIDVHNTAQLSVTSSKTPLASTSSLDFHRQEEDDFPNITTQRENTRKSTDSVEPYATRPKSRTRNFLRSRSSTKDSHNPLNSSLDLNKMEALATLNPTSSTSVNSYEQASTKKNAWQSIFSKTSHRRKASQKFAFFQKSQTSVPDLPKLDDDAINLMTERDPTSPAHYTLEESENQFDVDDLDKIMNEAVFGGEASSITTEFEENDLNSPSDIDNPDYIAPLKVPNSSTSTQRNSAPPTPEISNLLFAEQFEREQREEQIKSVQNNNMPLSRLTSVGRIPKVVSSRVQSGSRSKQSFSRPFATMSPKPAFEFSPSTAINATFSPYGTQGSASSSFAGLSSSQDLNRISMTAPPSAWQGPEGTSMNEFFRLSYNQDSDQSNSGSSSTMYFPTAAPTALTVGPTIMPSEDEVWSEYDDLIENVLTASPIKVSPLSEAAGSYFGLQNSSKNSPGNALFPALDGIEEHSSSDTKSPGKRPLPRIPSESTARSVKTSGAQRLSSLNAQVSVQISPEREKNYSGPDGFKRSSIVEEITDEVRTPLRTSIDPQSLASLRFRALMASKWLSFGKVIFSPAHQGLLENSSERVLVIDGLGKDWSYYCALNYPQATIYSLGAAQADTTNRKSLSAFSPPSNYRYLSHPDLTMEFPFPKNFFAAVVYRFPIAASDEAVKMTISECKRVLRPGGHIEISAIDLDLRNMGPRTRRAVRRLKMQMQTQDPSISLKASSDNLQNLLGRRGFERLNRCIVGVPATGTIKDSPRDSPDEQEIDASVMFSDNGGSAGDAGITKMISQVGRWWYTQSYEMGIIPDGDLTRSMWNDKALLEECKSLGTTFQLLICYAQKPSMNKRRTISL